MQRQDDTGIAAGHSGSSQTNNASSLWEEDTRLLAIMSAQGRECLNIAKAGYHPQAQPAPAEVACLPASTVARRSCYHLQHRQCQSV